MKNQELFDRTIGILVNAYLNDTLDYFNCKACAVGNLVAANSGFNLFKQDREIVCDNPDYYGDWADAIRLGEGEIYGTDRWVKNTYSEIKSTGYFAEELAKIELAFSDAGTGNKQDAFVGLMSVCDTLMQIHEANETEIMDAKKLFVKEVAV